MWNYNSDDEALGFSRIDEVRWNRMRGISVFSSALGLEIDLGNKNLAVAWRRADFVSFDGSAGTSAHREGRGPDGGYGHPDHIAISQFTTAAILCAADPSYTQIQGEGSYRISKLYYYTLGKEQIKVYQETFGELSIDVDGKLRDASGWQPWTITTHIDTEDYWQTVWQAVCCHRSQLVNFQSLEQQPAETHKKLWGHQTFYRALSLVNGGRIVETDLFDGLRND